MFGHSDKLKGTALMVTACVFFCVMVSLVKLVTHIDAFKIGLWRFVTGMGLLGTAALFGRIQLKSIIGDCCLSGDCWAEQES
jgi:EamA domain-containing membrane protein RarD